MKKNRIILSLLAGSVAVFSACTDLEVENRDSILTVNEQGEFAGVDATGALSTGYENLRGFADQANHYALAEVTSDELLVPTRGTDWGDNGVWRTLHQHTWDATHPQVLTTWNNLNSNAFRMNQVLSDKTEATAQQKAEAKFIRAFNMFHVLDMFRQVPYREPGEGPEVNPRVFTVQESFDFIMKDLEEAIPALPDIGPSLGTTGTLRASQASARFLMAKLLLNKHVYLGGEPQSADMERVIQLVDEISADGFDLAEGYFEIFEGDLDTETILYTDASSGNRIWNGLHYNQVTPDNTSGGWNGFTTTADFYALFEGDQGSNEPGAGQEERRGFVPKDRPELFNIGYGFLVGQQYGADGEQLTDRAGRPLVYTAELPGLTGNNERTGIRIIKYHPSNGAFNNHYIFFRYADAHLMKAEAQMRLGNTAAALETVNELRTIRDATPLASLTLMDILDERGRELYIEGWRRNDQVRFGTFTEPWSFKEASEEFRNVFPIPALAVATNPNLTQNPGY